MNKTDKTIIRKLAYEYLEHARSDRNCTNMERWKRHNDLKTQDFFILVDQFNLFEVMPGFVPQCTDPDLRQLEIKLTQDLFKFRNLDTDYTVYPYIEIPKVKLNSGIGISIEEETLSTQNSNITSHHFKDQLATIENVQALKIPIITEDTKATQHRTQVYREALGEDIPTRVVGCETPHFAPWDRIAEFRSITNILMDFMDNPDLMHATIQKFTDIHIESLKQLEAAGLLNPYAETAHCSQTFSKDFPGKNFDTQHVKSSDCWASGMAQLFATCSPAMFKEYELDYAKQYYAHTGPVNYGCCEPLHDMITEIQTISNIRKISVSPWADPLAAAEKMKKNIIMARKPNPAYLALKGGLSEDAIRREARETIDACKKTDTSCEFILKDLSTVQNEPQRLTRWCEIVREEINR